MVSTSDVVAVAIAALTVIVILAIGPFFGSTIDDTYSPQDDTSATTLVTFGAGSLVDETLNLSTETYTVTADGSGDGNIDNGSAADISASLTAEITANSSLFTAVDNTGTVTVTTILHGTEMNAYTSTTNITGASVTGATFSGAIDGSDWNRNVNTDLVSPATTWITLVGLIVLMFLGVIIAKVLGALKNMKE